MSTNTNQNAGTQMDNNEKLLAQISAAESKRAAATPGARAVRVVRAAATPARTDFGTMPDPVDLCLEIWKNWMAGDADRDLGAKTMRGLVGEGDGHGYDLYEAQQASDIKVAQATDAMINSLSRLHVWAIYRACSLATVWTFPNASLVEVAAEARVELRGKLRRNICTAVLF
ncbi:hypothetical protein GJ698_15025 [Pseudoduganella sp. FT26W]|uniref:Uncharacterized protein n=1 Tax=Duganella aquatilis TaxID=2666082 RepID=A0A844CX79_9BURK|nr:hypothetical protein [Duganella aquatilis]MRW85397.1 hypothetical protein [Duganella aquatilis]